MAQVGNKAKEIFLTERHIAEGIARINTLAGCSARLSRYRSDFNVYNATSNRSFNQIMSLCLNDAQSMILDLGFARYELSRKKKKVGSYTLTRDNQQVKTIEQYVSALKEIGRSLTPSSEPFYNAAKILCLKALFTTNSLNAGGV